MQWKISIKETTWVAPRQDKDVQNIFKMTKVWDKEPKYNKCSKIGLQQEYITLLFEND